MAAVVIDQLSAAFASPGATIQPSSQAAPDAAGADVIIQAQKGNGTGAGAPISFKAGTGGTTGAGGNISLIGGDGGSTSGAGGTVNLTGGAGAAGNANGSAVNVTGGAPQGSGTAGPVNIDTGPPGAGTANAVNIGPTNASKIAFGKPIDLSVGGSTAAAGADSAGATALPSATATIYPTSAADDAKGVRVSTADKVTGRTLLIGNGVSNKILKVYGPAGAVINGAAGDAAYSSASGKGVIITCLSSAGNTWLAWG